MERIFYPYVVAFQTVPKVAIAPIIVIWFGYGVASKVVITATIAFFPLLANTIMGLRAAPQDQMEMMVSYTASRWQVFRMVRLLQALPYIFVGLDVAIVLSVIGAIVGEFVGAKAGLGYLILQKNFNFDMAGTFAILIILSLIGVGLHALIGIAQRRIVFWMDMAGERVRVLEETRRRARCNSHSCGAAGRGPGARSRLGEPGGDLRPLAKQLRHACETIGFFYVANHGIPTPIFDGVFDGDAALFRPAGSATPGAPDGRAVPPRVHAPGHQPAPGLRARPQGELRDRRSICRSPIRT